MTAVERRGILLPECSPSSSTSSIEKLIYGSSELEGGRSSSFGARSSSTDDLDLRSKCEDFSWPRSSWPFEGERMDQGASAPQKRRRRKNILGEIDAADSDRDPETSSNVGRCVAGCAADCTALCCCPLTVFHVLALLVIKAPSTVAAKIARSWRNRKNARGNSRIEDQDLSNRSDFALRRSDAMPRFSRSDSSSRFSAPSPRFSPRSSPLPPPPAILGFGQHFWTEFGSGHSSFASP